MAEKWHSLWCQASSGTPHIEPHHSICNPNPVCELNHRAHVPEHFCPPLYLKVGRFWGGRSSDISPRLNSKQGLPDKLRFPEGRTQNDVQLRSYADLSLHLLHGQPYLGLRVLSLRVLPLVSIVPVGTKFCPAQTQWFKGISAIPSLCYSHSK